MLLDFLADPKQGRRNMVIEVSTAGGTTSIGPLKQGETGALKYQRTQKISSLINYSVLEAPSMHQNGVTSQSYSGLIPLPAR